MTDAELMAMAREAAGRAYAPYSRFRVGAAVLADDGAVYTGANVENAAFPSSLCAEAVTIGAAVAAGSQRLATIAVACLDASRCFPCGQCRQRMAEFGVERIVVQDGAGGFVSYAFDEMLPEAFGPDSLRN